MDPKCRKWAVGPCWAPRFLFLVISCVIITQTEILKRQYIYKITMWKQRERGFFKWRTYRESAAPLTALWGHFFRSSSHPSVAEGRGVNTLSRLMGDRLFFPRHLFPKKLRDKRTKKRRRHLLSLADTSSVKKKVMQVFHQFPKSGTQQTADSGESLTQCKE